MKKTNIKVMKLIIKILKFIFNKGKVQERLDKLGYIINKLELKNKNVHIGINTIIYNTEFSYSSKGDHFYIGNNCTITGATLLGHDASPCLFIPDLVIKKDVWLSGSRLSYRDPIYIGDNVFVGVGAIILPGIKVGNNVIIAAGSVVTSNIEDNSVYAGNPARKIKSIGEYINKYEKLYKENKDKF
ncbi:DapH/DapD/GlmU-related protein [Xenorhabdus sp. KJ12.1]|uniref:acyltransferase n=1 Tax=Xenorhabdus sp. KJ12.1 TaxID=1851571 RepID=UPI000C0662B1|nr:DapH/DapD/GlmU-related protein [Xenorhabdus sp. KJ12.1]PHM68340.1 chloramphenicol acetyltransferase [Xenorhabdus sp. KJ12.1]